MMADEQAGLSPSHASGAYDGPPLVSLLMTATVCAGLFGEKATLAQIPDLPGWNLVWNDEFDDPAVNTDNWELLTRRDSYNNEKQYYLPDQISIVDGHLRITATDEPLDGKLYRSGRMWTWQEWSYGRFEARADLPTTQGMWPAFWVNRRGVSWPTGGEIDIMENRGSQPTQVSSAYHWGTSVASHQYVNHSYSATDESGAPVDFHDGFHTYAAEWEPGIIRYYVDGNLHFTVTDHTAPILATPKSIILNLAVGGDFGGDPDGTTLFPQYFDVDYVRVWQRDPVSSVALVNTGFEGTGGGSLDGWTPFNDVGDNVVLRTDVAAEGTNSLKLSGRSTGGFNWQGVAQGVPVIEGMPLRASVESMVRSLDGLAGTGNYVNLKLEFYNTFGGTHGSSEFIDEIVFPVADNMSSEDMWTHHDFFATVPDGAVEARMTLIFLQPDDESGSVYLDLTLLEVFLPGDYNRNGHVDAADYTVWRDTLGQTVAAYSGADGNGNGAIDEGDFSVWRENFGTTLPGNAGAGSTAVIPEPSSPLTMAIGLCVGYAFLVRSCRS